MSGDGLVVVGAAANGTYLEAFRWTATTGLVGLGGLGTDSRAQATNADGSVVVGGVHVSGVEHPARWTQQTGMVSLGLPPWATSAVAWDVSADGNVLVGESSGTREAFKWTPGTGYVGLGDLPGGPFSSAAYGVSDSGSVIVGEGRTASASEAVFWAPTSQGPISVKAHLTSLGVTTHKNWVLYRAQSVSADGLRIVGQGQNPFGQNQAWMAILPAPWEPYCTAKVNSLGCTPAISGEGVPSATNVWSFEVAAVNVRNQKAGVFIYKVGGTQNAQPFQGGTLCIGPTGIRRTIGVNSGGNPAPADDCSGVYSIDMNAFAAGLLGGNPDPALQTPGETYHIQAWGRDQGFPPPNNTTLSNALEVPIGP